MPLAIFATITPKPEHLSDAVAAIEAIVAATRAERGCLRFDLHRGVETEQLHLYEIWADQAAFDHHHAQPYTRAVFRHYEAWLARPVELTILQPVA
ncbi:putative quinol monooxygenase [Methylorubrum salsuginis]|uniref:Quinol monooxygenase YgiN n=1 Tax=Methylorubrum salsuginis TaxID=414703 RepID=A0A1I4D5B0_9HYPH|nr:putative quinol monooxygenase [Methylorubrum salsuginis]SFK87607.1 Quinol monooxygenase YgiN [Methylorubrum salsuginis]